MKNLLALFLLTFVLVCPTYAQPGPGPNVLVGEPDGSPDNVSVYKLKFTNGSVTDNGDGTATVATASGATWSLNGLSAYYNAGNVGIGSSDPQYLLDVNGNVRVQSITIPGATEIILSNGETLTNTPDGYVTSSGGYIATSNIGIGTTNVTSKLTIQGAGTTTGINLQTKNSSATALVTMLDSGNVGIGTTVPQQLLDVNGSILAQGSGNTLLKQSGGNVGIGTTVPLGVLVVRGAGTTTGITFQLQNSSSTGLVTVLDSGNVGIGTTVPTAPLTVAGHIHSKGTAPTVANNDCGSTSQGAVTAKSTDTAGLVTAGTLTVTSCAVTFNGAFTNAPVCVATDDTNILAIKAAATTTKLTLTSTTSMSGDVISWICIGNE